MTDKTSVDHHKKDEYCHNRLTYRHGKKLTAVKVYTVASESKYLLVFGVPKINLQNEIRREFRRYGEIKSIANVTDHITNQGSIELEMFTDCFRLEYHKVEHARRAKKFSDAKNFYGGILHISYAPECESVDELSQKLTQRRAEVTFRLKVNASGHRKRKRPNETGLDAKLNRQN